MVKKRGTIAPIDLGSLNYILPAALDMIRPLPPIISIYTRALRMTDSNPIMTIRKDCNLRHSVTQPEGTTERRRCAHERRPQCCPELQERLSLAGEFFNKKGAVES